MADNLPTFTHKSKVLPRGRSSRHVPPFLPFLRFYLKQAHARSRTHTPTLTGEPGRLGATGNLLGAEVSASDHNHPACPRGTWFLAGTHLAPLELTSHAGPRSFSGEKRRTTQQAQHPISPTQATTTRIRMSQDCIAPPSPHPCPPMSRGGRRAIYVVARRAPLRAPFATLWPT